MMSTRVTAAPHTHAAGSVRGVMLTVWLALLPATAWGVWLFGWPSLFLLLVTVAFTLFGEAVALRIGGRPCLPLLSDGSALVTAWLLAMSLPPWAPWWVGAVGGLFAAVVGKQVFGGLGQNLFNPAMLARVALLISFPMEMTQWVGPAPLGSANAPGLLDGLAITFGGHPDIDAVSGASLLGHVKTELGRGNDLATALAGGFSPLGALLGQTRGSFAETSALLLLVGGLLLIFRRVIGWHIPAAMLGSITLLAGLAHLIDPEAYAGPLVHLLSGGLILGAFFIATDPVGSPASTTGKLIFGTGCGMLTYAIRTWGGYPEGLAFAVLLMNAATPLIDRYVRPRIYGRRRDGTPIDAGEETGP